MNASNCLRMRLRPILLPVLAGVLLSACASDPPPETPPPSPAPVPAAPAPKPETQAILDLNIQAEGGINPNAGGRQSPVVLRIYQLKSAAAFGQADFFDIYQRDAQKLAADMLRKDELLIQPAETRRLTLPLKPDTQALGFLAVFRQLGTARWRGAMAIDPRQNVVVNLGLSGNQLTVKPAAP